MATKRKDTDAPQKSTGDAAHAVARAGLSALPVIGGPAVELFQAIVQPPLERRRGEWMESVGAKLRELEERGLDLAALQDNEAFVSAVMHASQVALRTHQTEKLNALRNAVTNIAVGQGPDDALQHIFIEIIDSVTELHLRILKYFQAPTPPNGLGMGGLSHVLENAFPELRGNRGLYDQLWKDLYLRGLVTTDSLHVTMSGAGLAAKRTTEIADALLRFIEEHE